MKRKRKALSHARSSNASVDLDGVGTRSIEIRAEDMADGKLAVSFASELPVQEASWLPPIVLLHERGAVDYSSLSSALLNHDPDRIVGAVRDSTVDLDKRKSRATIVFDDDDVGNKARAKVQSGSLRGVSVRYRSRDHIELPEGATHTTKEGREFQGPLIVITRWQAIELSLTPIPADPTVGVGRTQGSTFRGQEMAKKKEVESGADATRTTGDPVVTTEVNADADDGGERPVAVTRAEASPDQDRPDDTDIMELNEIAEIAGLGFSEVRVWREKKLTAKQARSEALQVVGSRQTAIRPTVGVSVGSDPIDRMRKDAEYALAGRFRSASHIREGMKPGAAHMHAFWLLRQFEHMRGNGQAHLMDPSTYFAGQRASLSHAMDDFAISLENVANKQLRRAFVEAPSTYKTWTVPGSISDFKPARRVNFGQLQDFKEIPELMPIDEVTVGEARETIQLATFAAKFSISREAIISDDLSVFSRMVDLFGAAAQRTINKRVYDHLTGSVTMAEDAKALFATDHPSGSNLGTTAALSDTSLGEARKLMRLQKGLKHQGAASDVIALNTTAKYLLIPAAIEQIADKLVNGSFVPTAASGAAVPWIRALQVQTEAYLDSKSATAWYLIADPAQYDTIEVARLSGQEEPVLIRETSNNPLGVHWISYFDFGVRALNHRFMLKNVGA